MFELQRTHANGRTGEAVLQVSEKSFSILVWCRAWEYVSHEVMLKPTSDE